jgi:cell wall-associated NlpC family hydrolase
LTRAAIVSAAASWIGTPYVHQASAKGAGCDCLGLIRGVWRELYGIEPEAPPPYTPDWPERVFARETNKERVFARENQNARIFAGETEPLLAAARRNLVAKTSGEIEAGDVIVFRIAANGPAKHCAIASSPNAFIHAYAGRTVVESWMNRWWRARIAGVFEFPGVSSE